MRNVTRVSTEPKGETAPTPMFAVEAAAPLRRWRRDLLMSDLRRWSRMFWLVSWRNRLWWLLPVLIVIAWYAGRERFASESVLWVRSSAAFGAASIFLGPVLSGVAAWIASEIRGEQQTHLLGSMPNADRPHLVVTGLSLGFVSTVSYIIGGGYWIVDAGRGATWGSWDPRPALIGLCVVSLFLVIGFAFGTVWPTPFAAPIVTLLGLSVPIGIAGYVINHSVRYLTPMILLHPEEAGVLATFWPTVFWPLVAWFLGLTIAALSLFWLRASLTWLGGSLAAVGGVLAIGGAWGLVTLPSDLTHMPREEMSYTLVCEDAIVEVCVHPAYRNALEPTIEVVNAVFTPVLGLPGVPERIEQFANPDGLQPGERILHLPPPVYDAANGQARLAFDYVVFLFDGRPLDDDYSGFTEVQCALAWWLIAEAGFDDGSNQRYALVPWTIRSPAEIERLERTSEAFAALPDDQRRAWLEVNMERVRNGELTLDDLPI